MNRAAIVKQFQQDTYYYFTENDWQKNINYRSKRKNTKKNNDQQGYFIEDNLKKFKEKERKHFMMLTS